MRPNYVLYHYSSERTSVCIAGCSSHTLEHRIFGKREMLSNSTWFVNVFSIVISRQEL